MPASRPAFILSRYARQGTSSTLLPAATKPKLPLEGIRILDLSRVLAGPYCTQILGDLGAEVIKIEHPTRGDDTRSWGPPYAPYKDGRTGPGESAYYLSVNRNKKSLGLSFKEPLGVSIIQKLAAKADVVVENYLPRSLEKYGLDYATLGKDNDRLIYASITGYGQFGPYSDRAGFDVMVEAEMGLMHITGARDGPPVKVGVAVTDLTTGMYAANSILAALFERERSGKGQYLDVCLSDCQVATLSNMAESVLVTGKRDTGRWGTAHPSVVPYRAFRTSDGDILFGGANDRLFGVLSKGLGKPEWATDERFATNSSRVANRDLLEKWIEDITTTKTTQEWLEIFDGSGLPYAKVNDLMDTMNHSHVQARNMVIEVDHPSCGPLKLINSPVKYSRTQPTIRTPPPLLGEHTEDILMNELGFKKSDIDEMKQNGVVA
ncbi:CoA-transferase family III domain-containing protein [Xylogone sp. PMI_703]|nr:CoA-transferase family III domain-containing protein [Xylogone sp. PMI_703]